MTKFKIGDRVRVYGSPLFIVRDLSEDRCRVVVIDPGGRDMTVEDEGTTRRYVVSMKQCRKLKPKKQDAFYVPTAQRLFPLQLHFRTSKEFLFYLRTDTLSNPDFTKFLVKEVKNAK